MSSTNRLPPNLQAIINRQLAAGRGTCLVQYLQRATLSSRAEPTKQVRTATRAGLADMAAGRFRTIATSQDSDNLLQQMLGRLPPKQT